MFKNYLKIASRNLFKYKTYTLINILGLSVGIACTILILLFVKDELSYDKFYKNHDRIYRVTREWLNNDGESSLHLARVAPPIAMLLKNDYPDLIEEIARVRAGFNTLIKLDDGRSFVEQELFWAEENFFRIFDYEFIYGNPESALKEPNSIVLTKSIAEKYFGDENPVDKVINYEDRVSLKVTGVINNLPQNTHFQFDILGSFKTLVPVFGEEYFRTNWSSNNYLTYILFPENVTPETLESRFPEFLDRHLSDREGDGTVDTPVRMPHETNILHLQRLTDIHLKSHLSSEVGENGNIDNIYLFVIIALFILGIACINFMNLATARSAKRAREIGMRKVLGALRQQLVYQFLGESFFISLLSLIVAIIMVELMLPSFNTFAGKELSLNIFSDPFIGGGLVLFLFIVSLISGSYPAAYLSGFIPVEVLKSKVGLKSGSILFRKILVVSQFTISIALIIAVGIVIDQMKFMQNKDLGFTKEQIVLLPADNTMWDKAESIKGRLKMNPGVVNASFSRLVPSDRLLNSWGARTKDGDNPGQVPFRIAVIEIDYDFFNTYDMEIVAGRMQSREFASDSAEAFVLNEEAVKKLGWLPVENAVGRPFVYGNRSGRIVGVVADNNFESLHNKIAPQIYVIQPQVHRVSVRVNPENLKATLAFLENEWSGLRPDYPFEYTFLDERFEELYREEARLGELTGMFSGLAIFIACLGLFGLASFEAEQKTKEIGIRKTLGATVSSIVINLSSEFLKLVLISNLIAWPVAFWGMKEWLGTFAYSTSISAVTFIMAGTAALIISLLTVSFQSVKAALANPIKSLHYE